MPVWHDFAMLAGTAASALTGLLFVAVSLRESILARSVHLRLRAAQTLGLFVVVVISALLMVLPNPTDWALGTELMVTAVLAGVVLALFGRAAGRADDQHPLERVVDRFNPTLVTPSLIVLSGILLVTGIRWALAILVLGVVFALIAGIANAWIILVRIHD